jgi:hypothetical protein
MMTNDATPVFVKIEEYKEVLDIIDVIKAKLGKAKDTLNQINVLKEEEDGELAAWTGNIDDIADRVEGIDKAIFGKK